MSNILSSEDFGLKLYSRFPIKYQEDDMDVDFALKRYLEALSDGGFKHTIEEINGIPQLIDPSKTRTDVLPILFKQFGLEIFNGIPENYLRYLLPKLGEAWSKKGSLSVIEFITSSLTGIKTSTKVEYDKEENPTVLVRLEMDYNIGDYFPESTQFSRLLKNFVPFYCDLGLVYSYLFYESSNMTGKEEELQHITDSKTEELVIDSEESEAYLIKSSGSDITSIRTQYDNSATNRVFNTLNNNFFTNSMHSYDIIHKSNGSTEVVY